MHPLVDVIIPAQLAPGESFAQRLARNPDRDVLLVDSAATPSEGAIERLVACARREPSVATISTFSDRGLIAYPASAPADTIEGFFAGENAGIAVEIPSAVPPCVYIGRRALGECGGLDDWEPRALAKFCVSATSSGYRHVLSGDVFVPMHAGLQREDRWRQALEADASLSAQWADFASRAPATPLRRRVDLARLRASRLPRIVFITHRWGGGVELHVKDLARLLADDCEVLVLRPGVGNTVQLQWLRRGETLEAWFDAATDWVACRELLRSLGIARVHVHHVHGIPRQALDLAADLSVPYDVTLHDHFAICPQYHLADETGRYCGEPDVSGCTACVEKRPAQWNLGIAEWRQLFREVLERADRVIAPSADIASRIQRYFPSVSPQVWPHPEMREMVGRVNKVLLLGGLSAIKGMDLFEACVRDAQARALPLHFQVLGHTSRPLEVKDAPVAVLGSYDDARLATLVSLERPDAFLFLSQVPETYSYTLSVAMKTGKPIVATAMGAFVERLRGYSAATLVPAAADPIEVNDALLRLLTAVTSAPPTIRSIAASAD